MIIYLPWLIAKSLACSTKYARRASSTGNGCTLSISGNTAKQFVAAMFLYMIGIEGGPSNLTRTLTSINLCHCMLLNLKTNQGLLK